MVEAGKEIARGVSGSKEGYEGNAVHNRYLEANSASFIASIGLISSKPSVLSKVFKDLKDVVVTKDNATLISMTSDNDNGTVNISKNLISNPIYGIRNWAADLSVKWTKSNIEQKNQLALLRRSLEADLRNEPSSMLEKELARTNDRIKVLEFGIKKDMKNMGVEE